MFTILTILMAILFALLVAQAVTNVVIFVFAEIKAHFYWKEVEERCNRNTEKRLAQILAENMALKATIKEQEAAIHRCGKLITELQQEVVEKEFESEALSEEKDRIGRITQAVARGVKQQQAEAALQISYLSSENENLLDDIKGRWQTIDFLRETVSELKNTVEGQDALILSLQEKVSLFGDIILELHEELDLRCAVWANEDEDAQEAASIQIAATRLRRAQYRAEKAFLRSMKQARKEANRVSKG